MSNTTMRLITRTRLAVLASGVCFFSQGCTGSEGTTPLPPSSTARLHGTATWNETVTLPADATLEVIIEDVSRADVRAEVVARELIREPGTLPVRFTLDYPVNRILPGHRYNVRGRIEQQGRLLFITDTHHELPPIGNAASIELRLARTGVSAASTAALENTYWKLLQLGDARVRTPEGQREIHLVLQVHSDGTRRVAGFGGCNRLAGSYTLDADRIAFTHMASTMMACEQGVDTERDLHAALAEAAGWAIRGEQLDLLDAAGKRIALFESVYLR